MKNSTGMPTAEPCKIGTMPKEREVYPHKFAPELKRVFFEGLKVLRPELAKVMAEDAFVQALKQRFGGVFVFPESEAKRILDAGHQAIKQKEQ